VVPGAATAPALILVGALMMQAAKDIDWVDLSEGVPAFLTVILMPLTFSIANGVSFGVIAYCAIKLLSGEGKKVSPILYVVALLLIARYVFLAEG
jgi:AGZA family xanthine/uracil permease-like MFS transporter